MSLTYDNEAVEEQRALIDRVLASPAFEKSARMRSLLRYICDRALSGHPEEVHEQFIGHVVFDRPIDYDTAVDNIVRVSVRHLRTKLRVYFETDGRQERWEMTIPKGHYLPVFHERVPPNVPSDQMKTHLWRTLPSLRLGTFTIVLVTIVIAFFFLGARFVGRDRASLLHEVPQMPSSSLVMALFGGTQKPVQIVLGDPALVLMQNLSRHYFNLKQYADRRYRNVPRKLSDYPGIQGFWNFLASRQLLNIGNEEAASRLLKSMLGRRPGVTIRSACNMTVRDFMSGNFILLGSPLSNPWMRLFLKDHLNFRLATEGPDAGIEFRNVHPRPGERDVYLSTKKQSEDGLGYARIALVSNLTNTGRVLMVGGTTMEATEASADFLLNPSSNQKVLHILDMARAAKNLPDFELLLQTQGLEGAPKSVHLIAYRVYLSRTKQYKSLEVQAKIRNSQ